VREVEKKRRKTAPITIVVAEDDAIFRDGLRVLLQVEREFVVVGESSDADGALEAIGRLRPQVLLSGANIGLKVLKEINPAENSVRVILLAPEVQESQIVEALLLGASGLVTNDTTPELLFKAIRTVLNGQYWVGRDTVNHLVQALREYALVRNERRKDKFGLTAREMEIVQALTGGDTNRDIAKRFSISEQTVKHHLTSIYSKVGVSQRIELVVLALSQNWIKVDIDTTRQAVQIERVPALVAE